MKLLVAIPCLNEEQTIRDVIAKIPKAMPGVSHLSVLVIDDGSEDQTHVVAKEAGATVVRHPLNRGVGAAFQTAVNYAIEHGFELMINVDGDGQFNPADMPKLVEPVILGHADMVTASRFKDATLIPQNMPTVKRYGNYMMSMLVSKLLNKKFYDVSCGFRCYSREALLKINLHGAFTYTQETFLDFCVKNLRILEIPIRVVYFEGRKSRVAGSILKYAFNTASIIFKGYRDYFPLKFFWGAAAVFALPAVIFGILFFGHFIRTGLFSGYLYAGFLSGFFGALSFVLFLVGIVADMLDRVRANQERILYYLRKSL